MIHLGKRHQVLLGALGVFGIVVSGSLGIRIVLSRSMCGGATFVVKCFIDSFGEAISLLSNTWGMELFAETIVRIVTACGYL